MLLYLLDLIGIAVFAISGALAAGRKGLDLVGVIVLALVTAVGGGTIRDVLLDRHPIFWLADPAYVIVITIAALATVAHSRRRKRPPPESAMVVADALGLALFSVAGAQIAESAGLPAVAGVVLGTVTGAAGGAVRDVLSAEVPLVLRPGTLYASAAVAGTSVYFGLSALELPHGIATAIGMLVVVMVRFASIRWGIQLPAFWLTGERAVDGSDRSPHE